MRRSATSRAEKPPEDASLFATNVLSSENGITSRKWPLENHKTQETATRDAKISPTLSKELDTNLKNHFNLKKSIFK